MVTISCSYQGTLHCEAQHPSGALLNTDAPKDNQGRGEAFSPTDLLAASLATCMITVMGIAARDLGVDLTNTRAVVEKKMQASPRRVAALDLCITSPFTPSSEQQKALELAAHRCPVKASLHPDLEVRVVFQWGIA